MPPKVSIVIPCLNEEAYIIKCLDSINKQTYPQAYLTTYVCDGNSTDNTLSLLRGYSTTNSQFFVLENKHKTTPYALNLGIVASKADIIIILGAHSELDENYVTHCVSTFQKDANIMCVGGILKNVYENETSKIIGSAMSSVFGVGNAHFRTGAKSGYVDTVAFGAYKKEIFDKVGLFDVELIRNQDDEFNYRITSNGFKIYLNPEITCKYYVRASFAKLFKQYYQYGYWKVYVNTKHKTVTTTRQLIPLFFVLYLISLGIITILNLKFGSYYSVFLLLYLFMSLYFAVKQSNKPLMIFKIAYTFFILHISYGTGYLKGIIDFLVLRKSIKKSESLSR